MFSSAREVMKTLLTFNSLVGGTFALGATVLTASPYWETWIWKAALAVWLLLFLVLVFLTGRTMLRVRRRAIPLCEERFAAYARGQANYRAGNLAQAAAEFEAATKGLRGFAVARYERARALHGLGEDETALRELGAALRIDPNFVNAHELRSRIVAAKSEKRARTHGGLGRTARVFGSSAVFGLALWLVLSAGFAVWMVRADQARGEEFVIAVADISEPAGSGHCVTEEVLAQLRIALADCRKARVVALGKPIPEQGGPGLARAVGGFHGADVVVWGWIAFTEEAARSWIHIESLGIPGTIGLVDGLEECAISVDIESLQSFALQIGLAGQMSDRALVLNAACRYEAGDFEGAINSATKAIDRVSLTVLEGEEIHARLIRGSSLLARAGQTGDRGLLAACINDLSIVLEDCPRIYLACLNRGWARLFTGDYVGSRGDFDCALEIRPDDPNAHSGAGLARMYLKEPRDVVMAFLEEAVALEPENASFIHNRGIAKFRFHDYEGAADDLRSAIQLNPDNAGYYYDLGTVLRYLEGENEGQSLIEVFTTGIRIAEEEGAEYYEGLCYSGRGFVRTTLGDLEGAIEDYSRAIDLVPTEWRFHSEIGALYMKLGKFEDAISSFADAIDRAPTESLPYVQRSEAREKIGDRRGAREDREEADRLREAGMDS